MRKDLLIDGQVYHIFTKSIAGFKIFNNADEFFRIVEIIRYYQREKPAISFCRFIDLPNEKAIEFRKDFFSSDTKKLIEIIAYCIMPTHLHLVLKQLKEDGISSFMNNILNSYTRYFNLKHNRKGPLWEGRFKNVLVKDDEQLLHLTRYIHLNPVTTYLVNKPEDWLMSSYREYLSEIKDSDKICRFGEILEIEPKAYKKFVEDRVSYQRQLSKIKGLLLEDPFSTA